MVEQVDGGARRGRLLGRLGEPVEVGWPGRDKHRVGSRQGEPVGHIVGHDHVDPRQPGVGVRADAEGGERAARLDHVHVAAQRKVHPLGGVMGDDELAPDRRIPHRGHLSRPRRGEGAERTGIDAGRGKRPGPVVEAEHDLALAQNGRLV